ncbi:helix-turn-helix domain-containing protein [Umezawaea sp. NPDC059074]|uniref:helix-turn-helix domain-containing protein n=1 Tax=Umezawaea sp. NPDC059074 TaxID=3346716 RepID=UPI003688562A
MGAHLRALRRELDVQPGVMARAFGVSTALISKVEQGRRGLSTQALGMYCDVLDVSPLDLLMDVAEQYRAECDPFLPDGYRAIRRSVRVVDGLALYVDLPERYLPAGALRLATAALNDA